MKKLEDFQTETVNLKGLFGGNSQVVQTQKEKSISADGNCCYMKTDWYADFNGNGKQDSNEICQEDTDWFWFCG